MSISTSDIYNIQKYDVKGLAIATHSEALSLARGFIAELGGIIGGKSDLMKKKIDDVMAALVQKLQAQISGGERIVGVKFEFAEMGRSDANTFLSGIATGTIITPRASPAVGGNRRKAKAKATRKARKNI